MNLRVEYPGSKADANMVIRQPITQYKLLDLAREARALIPGATRVLWEYDGGSWDSDPARSDEPWWTPNDIIGHLARQWELLDRQRRP